MCATTHLVRAGSAGHRARLVPCSPVYVLSLSSSAPPVPSLRPCAVLISVSIPPVRVVCTVPEWAAINVVVITDALFPTSVFAVLLVDPICVFVACVYPHPCKRSTVFVVRRHPRVGLVRALFTFRIGRWCPRGSF